MSTFSFLPAGIGAIRLLSSMAIFAFASFIAVDSFMVEGSIADLVQVRVIWILGASLLLWSTWTRIALRHATAIGMVICVWTGSGVVLLTEITGGASSPYWTMVMLTFFTVALILPMKAWQAAVSFGSVAVFYYAWMMGHDATGSSSAWVSSNAGIWLAALVSVGAVAFLDQLRMRDTQQRQHLEMLNQQLRAEITERERVQKVALRTQQLDAVGQLASGLAHELNNLLMVISGAAEILQQDPSTSIKNTERIVESAQRGGRLTSDLLLFARDSSREDEPFCVDQMVQDIVELVQSSHRGRIDVRYKSPAKRCWVKGDAQLLSQVVLNLCLNSIDAMNGNGTLQLVIHPTSPTEDEGETSLTWVQIEVVDHGKGMDEESLQRAFEPFFTTKAPGEGTGLGLSMAYGTIQHHDGTLELESVVGKGTRAVIRLPQIQEPIAPVLQKEPARCPDLSLDLSPRCILLVDDDPMVRAVMQEVLRNFGFNVIPARNGADALTQIQNVAPAPDLVILDMMMPVMGGAEAFIRIRKIQPDVPILVYSGFALEQSTIESFSGGKWKFLRKPFTNAELHVIVNQLVASPTTKKSEEDSF